MSSAPRELPALVERLSDLLAAAVVKDLRRRLAERERGENHDGDHGGRDGLRRGLYDGARDGDEEPA